jgi:adenylosuccinate lyase
MAQKENPVNAENVVSLARIVRSLVIPAYENVALWHERDLTNSASERILIPHACVLLDDMLARSTEVFRSLRVYPDRMKENLEATKGQVMSESVMIALTRKGMGRQEAHRLVRDVALKARTKGLHLRDALKADKRIKALLTDKEIDEAMRPERYIGQSEAIVASILTKVR